MEHTFKSLDEIEITDPLCAEYNGLLFELTGRDCNVSKEQLEEVQSRFASELLLGLFDESNKLIGTAQGSFICIPLYYTVYINIVVIAEEFRGHGLGKFLIEELERRSKERWPQVEKFTLTSSPKRNLQGFYLKLGYHQRTKEAGDETVVYVKSV